MSTLATYTAMHEEHLRHQHDQAAPWENFTEVQAQRLSQFYRTRFYRALTPPWRVALWRLRHWARRNSIWAVHFNSGSCNGCDIEILATLTPRYDAERLGVRLQGSPRHADVLICTGPVTLQARERLRRIYEQMPEPKWVMAVGACALTGGAFRGCYNVVGQIDEVIPVDVYVPGCPPRPEAVLNGVLTLLKQLETNPNDVDLASPQPPAA